MSQVKLALLGVLSCLLLTACGGGGGPGDTVVNFYKAVAKGDTETAKKYIDPAELSGEKGQMLSMMVPKMKAMLDEKEGLKSIKVVDEKITGDTATVKVEFKFGDGTTESETGQVKKIKGKWYLAD